MVQKYEEKGDKPNLAPKYLADGKIIRNFAEFFKTKPK